MDFHGFSWIFMDLQWIYNGFSWILMDFHGLKLSENNMVIWTTCRISPSKMGLHMDSPLVLGIWGWINAQHWAFSHVVRSDKPAAGLCLSFFFSQGFSTFELWNRDLNFELSLKCGQFLDHQTWRVGKSLTYRFILPHVKLPYLIRGCPKHSNYSRL